MTTIYVQKEVLIVIFIDNYSRKTWLYLLKTKDEVFNMFQKFKAEI
jgi:hypothetical protein